MNYSISCRTARIARLCYSCRWGGFRGVPTILPGHRYLRHVAFPEGPGGEINQTTKPIVADECVACANWREQAGALDVIDAGACMTFCCGETPCARPLRHDDDHECRTCAARR
jgi:hypothetical protein